MIHLLDVNVLIALGDANHCHSELAVRFFEDIAVHGGWATCPLTENAFLRIFGNPNYPGGPGSPQEARRVLTSILAAPGYRFWPDDQSLSDTRKFPLLPSSAHLTDLYLLSLAVSKGGIFATFDGRIDSSMISGGKNALLVLS